MTKQEFIQEAVLRLLSARPTTSMENIYDLAMTIAGYVYPDTGDFQEDPPDEVELNDEPIENLLREIDRLDEESTRQLREKSSCYFQKGGYAAKVRRICENYDFVHVPNFIDFGKGSFEKERGIGEKCCAVVDQALKNLYNITSW